MLDKNKPAAAPMPAGEKKGGVAMDFGDAFDGGKKATKPPASAGKNDRPWRKPAAAVKAEREASAKILGSNGGVNLESVRLAMAVQEVLDGADHAQAQAACTKLLQVATNARPAAEVQEAHAALEVAVAEAGLKEAVVKKALKAGGGATAKLQLLHEVMPRLWVGGWAALNDDCAALRQRKVTHVVSVLSADQRRLPEFIKQHLYVRVDDTEEAADTLASHFDEIVAFVEAARASGGIVFVHCGAGISRAPTSTCAYVIWKLRMPAADAIKLCRAARPCTRPNVGFVAALKAYEKRTLAGAEGEAVERPSVAVGPAAVAPAVAEIKAVAEAPPASEPVSAT